MLYNFVKKNRIMAGYSGYYAVFVFVILFDGLPAGCCFIRERLKINFLQGQTQAVYSTKEAAFKA